MWILYILMLPFWVHNCPSNLKWFCGSSCTKRCGEPTSTSCSTTCVKGCHCPDDMWYDEDKNLCVQEYECLRNIFSLNFIAFILNEIKIR